MLAYFSAEQFGLFRYYDPFIASYFFPSLDQTDNAFWMGPISQLEWYNVTWRERVNSRDKWKSHINTEAEKWQSQQIDIQVKPILKSQHIQVFEQMQQEKVAYKWQQDNHSNTTQANIDQVVNWVQEAIQIGCWTDSEVESYLQIRSQYPAKPLPENIVSQELKQKLADIKYHLQTMA